MRYEKPNLIITPLLAPSLSCQTAWVAAFIQHPGQTLQRHIWETASLVGWNFLGRLAHDFKAANYSKGLFVTISERAQVQQ